jgi:exopolysaccharide biosynthesis operon protein EpsL
MDILVMARKYRSITALALNLISAAHAHAEGMLELEPYVSAGMTYDDNVFRVSDKNEARALLGDDATSDTTQRLEAGIHADLKLSRQHFRLDLSANRSRFDRFGFLDNEGDSRKLAWDWQFGNHLGGELSVSEDTSMGGFTELQNPVLNMRTRKRQLATVNWDVHPRWRLRAIGEEVDVENSLESYRSSDRTESIREIGVQHRTPQGSQVGLFGRQIDSEYAQRDAFSLVLFGNANRQQEMGVDLAWIPGGKSRVEGRFARVERKYEELSGRDFSGWSGRASVFWQATGKTAMSLSASRDIYGVDDLAATYAQTDTLSFIPSWMPTSKISVQGRATYERRNYLGDPSLVIAGAEQREDIVKVAGLSVSYVPYYKVSMQLSWQTESRESSVRGAGYDASSLTANLRAEF